MRSYRSACRNSVRVNSLRLPILKRFLRNLLVLIGVTAIGGAHVAMFQAYAWGRMIAERASASESVIQVVKENFSGEKPCSRCQAIGTLISHQKETGSPKSLQSSGGEGTLILSITEVRGWVISPPDIPLFICPMGSAFQDSKEDPPFTPPPEGSFYS